jgi:hypothetical protein
LFVPELVLVRVCVSPLQGVKKTKLGLREFVKLGDFQQIIDTQQQQAVSATHANVLCQYHNTHLTRQQQAYLHQLSQPVCAVCNCALTCMCTAAVYCCCVLLQLNVVYFKVAGLGLMTGNLSIKASYAVESEQRVSIKFIESTLVSSCVCRAAAAATATATAAEAQQATHQHWRRLRAC